MQIQRGCIPLGVDYRRIHGTQGVEYPEGLFTHMIYGSCDFSLKISVPKYIIF